MEEDDSLWHLLTGKAEMKDVNITRLRTNCIQNSLGNNAAALFVYMIRTQELKYFVLSDRLG